ncbi:MAG TPA: SMP-30/gluconolactonase/LRE family protein, partial [Planctomycetaceae bacterium]|nr:SMP-30/gluconolactonase/LRE family protein [Planctomycetaceae bacterium]
MTHRDNPSATVSNFDHSARAADRTQSRVTARRSFLATTAAALVAAKVVVADDFEFGEGPVRYPDPRLISLDDRFNKLKLGNTPIQRIHYSRETLWTEGPAWNGVGRYLIWSDIPNNIQQRWLEEDGHVSTFRHPANNSNGNTFDLQGRQISFEHLTRSVARYEVDGTRTVLADKFEGKSLNAPNDGVVHPNGDIWFTDPGYGALVDYEGALAKTDSVQPYQKEAIFRIEASTGKVFKVTDEIFKPNGLCFS